MMRGLYTLTLALLLASPALATGVPPITTEIVTAKGKHIILHLERAMTPAQRAHGLMERTTLKPHDGMAFFFPHPSPQKFWMKNTLIPLDIIFINEAGKIIGIYTAAPQSLTPVGPDGFVSSVIEIDGGRAAKDGIEVGNEVGYDSKVPPQSLAH